MKPLSKPCLQCFFGFVNTRWLGTKRPCSTRWDFSLRISFVFGSHGEISRRKIHPVFMWQEPLFGTTSSPCCATYAMQKLMTAANWEKMLVSRWKLPFMGTTVSRVSVQKRKPKPWRWGFAVSWPLEALTNGSGRATTVSFHQPPLLLPNLPTVTFGSIMSDQTPMNPHSLHWHCPTDMLSYKHRPTFMSFCDASETVYGSVAYLVTETYDSRFEIAFLAERSRVTSKKQQSNFTAGTAASQLRYSRHSSVFPSARLSCAQKHSCATIRSFIQELTNHSQNVLMLICCVLKLHHVFFSSPLFRLWATIDICDCIQANGNGIENIF